MKPASFICLMATGLIYFSCNQKQLPQQTGSGNSIQNNNGNNAGPSVINGDSLSAAWYVKGCASDANKADNNIPSKIGVNNNPDQPTPFENSIRAEADSIIYNRYVHHGCCRKVKVNTEKQGNVITITEYWWGQICKCMCSSDVKAVIRHLPKGVYQVYAVETGTDPIDDKPSNARDTLMHQLVTIK